MTVSEFFSKLCVDMNRLSKRTGVPKYMLQRFAREDRIPTAYMAVFLVEADISRVRLPLHLFTRLYAPKEDRLRKVRRGRKTGEAQFIRMLGLKD